MSGGVDSSVAAALLVSQGHDVVGVTMRLHAGNDSEAAAARAVCEKLQINHYIVDARDAFRKHIIGNFVAEYEAGRTPNPCVLCNRVIKWGVFIDEARKLGATHIATGHYAQLITQPDGMVQLRRGTDDFKDQSYALWNVPQEALRRTRFPLGTVTKDETRRIAEKFDLATAKTEESQDICFIPDDDYGAFLAEWAEGQEETPGALQPGPILDRDGKRIGTHPGTAFVTIGQRKGLGIALGRPCYVTKIDAPSRTIWVGENEDLLASGLVAGKANWCSGIAPEDGDRIEAKVRYLSKAVPATVTILDSNTGFQLIFDQPQRAITPGQSAVLYRGDIVLGGGIIETSIP